MKAVPAGAPMTLGVGETDGVGRVRLGGGSWRPTMGVDRVLIDSYWESLALVRSAHRAARRRKGEQARLDRQHLSSMERDLVWVLKYLETGHPPEHRRGTYRWIVPVDPRTLDTLVKVRTAAGPGEWRALDSQLDRLLALLAPREREAFALVRGQGCSFRETAEYMGLRSSGTASHLVRRAERKLRKAAEHVFVAHPTAYK